MKLMRKVLAAGGGLMLVAGPVGAAPGALGKAPDPPLVEEVYVSFPTACHLMATTMGRVTIAAPLPVQVLGQCGVPTTAVAVSADFLATQATTPGVTHAFAGGTAEPASAVAVYDVGKSSTFNSDVALCQGCAGGDDMSLTNSGGLVHLSIDINGYYTRPDTTAVDSLGARVLALETVVGNTTKPNPSGLVKSVNGLKTAVDTLMMRADAITTRVNGLVVGGLVTATGVGAGDVVSAAVDAKLGTYKVQFTKPVDHCWFTTTTTEPGRWAVIPGAPSGVFLQVVELDANKKPQTDSGFDITGVCE